MVWKPILRAVAVVAVREVSVLVIRLAVDKARREWIKKEGPRKTQRHSSGVSRRQTA